MSNRNKLTRETISKTSAKIIFAFGRRDLSIKELQAFNSIIERLTWTAPMSDPDEWANEIVNEALASITK